MSTKSIKFETVTNLQQVIENMKRFEQDLNVEAKLRKQLKQFHQWYYVHDGDLLAPSKFIGYQNMTGNLYVNKRLLRRAKLDGRETEHVLKTMFIPYENEALNEYIRQKLNGQTRVTFKVNILEQEKEAIEKSFTKGASHTKVSDLLQVVIEDVDALQEEGGYRLEGAEKLYFVKKYERDPHNRKRAIEIHGLNCYACGFNFEEMYGERGKDFIEVHHLQPLSTLKEEVQINPKTDLVPLCANCHRMVHRKKDNVLTIEELKRIIER